MSGTLFVVATPIGNLEDITLRALRVLRGVSLIAAEDTRHSAKLLQHHGIGTRTISFHEHNARSRVPQLIARLRAGDSVALVSDAGTPVLSDPGLDLVRSCIENKIQVDPIPGANAPLTALVTSGFAPEPLTILGFAPNRANARIGWLEQVRSIRHTVIFFEAPHRIAQTLTDAQAILGNRPLMVARELTKVHQEFLRGTAAELCLRLTNPRGEFTVVVGPEASSQGTHTQPVDSASLAGEFGDMTDVGGLTRRQAITALSRKYGLPSREIYSRLEGAKRGVS